MHLRRVCEELGLPQQGATPILEDNQGCIKLADNPIRHGRTKHIEIRYHFVREKVADGTVELVWTPTEGQTADGFTKSLARAKFEMFRDQVLGEKPLAHNDNLSKWGFLCMGESEFLVAVSAA